MFCPQCGAPNEDDAVFCGNCGAVLNPDEVPADAETEIVDEILVGEPEGEVVEEDPFLEESLAEPVPPPPVPPPPPPAGPRTVAAPSVPTSGLAIASLVLGIGGLTILPLLGSVLAIILGYMARREIRQRPDQVSGDGLALAGIVMGWIAVALAVVGLVVFGSLTLCGVCGALGASGY